MKRIIALALVCVFMPSYSYACWQVGQAGAIIQTTSLNGRVTDNEKPREGMRFDLHRAITFDRVEAQKTGAWEQPTLKTVTADSSGLFSFGEVPPGRYWIVSGKGNLSESFAVEVWTPKVRDAYQRLWVRYWADGCQDLLVEDANRK